MKNREGRAAMGRFTDGIHSILPNLVASSAVISQSVEVAFEHRNSVSIIHDMYSLVNALRPQDQLRLSFIDKREQTKQEENLEPT